MVDANLGNTHIKADQVLNVSPADEYDVQKSEVLRVPFFFREWHKVRTIRAGPMLRNLRNRTFSMRKDQTSSIFRCELCRL